MERYGGVGDGVGDVRGEESVEIVGEGVEVGEGIEDEIEGKRIGGDGGLREGRELDREVGEVMEGLNMVCGEGGWREEFVDGRGIVVEEVGVGGVEEWLVKELVEGGDEGVDGGEEEGVVGEVRVEEFVRGGSWVGEEEVSGLREVIDVG